MNGIQLGWIDYTPEHRTSRRDKTAFLIPKKRNGPYAQTEGYPRDVIHFAQGRE